jgi:hypothetical protein
MTKVDVAKVNDAMSHRTGTLRLVTESDELREVSRRGPGFKKEDPAQSAASGCSGILCPEFSCPFCDFCPHIAA